mmetsp:Transcript_8009/g.12206  ORF Transcript_8009/g.12206 Transcript_8009/m.12206 type:complete len:302 (+) Transcript_8009:19-924(+)
MQQHSLPVQSIRALRWLTIVKQSEIRFTEPVRIVRLSIIPNGKNPKGTDSEFVSKTQIEEFEIEAFYEQVEGVKSVKEEPEGTTEVPIDLTRLVPRCASTGGLTLKTDVFAQKILIRGKFSCLSIVVYGDTMLEQQERVWEPLEKNLSSLTEAEKQISLRDDDDLLLDYFHDYENDDTLTQVEQELSEDELRNDPITYLNTVKSLNKTSRIKLAQTISNILLNVKSSPRMLESAAAAALRLELFSECYSAACRRTLRTDPPAPSLKLRKALGEFIGRAALQAELLKLRDLSLDILKKKKKA